MTRYAIYARYSSDVQNESSIEDQITICRRFADTRGWEETGTFADAATSGSAMANRPGILAALRAIEAGKFDVLLAEDEDRVARDLEQQAHIFNRIRDAGGQLWTIATGKVELMHVAMKGFMAEDFIRNLSAKTKRGMRSNAEKGKATGSRLYGYRSAPGGDIVIIQEEAEIVRRIFAAYASGETPRDIASSLNADGIPAPRGGQWTASTINGSRQRGNGVLNTEQYAGVKVWNRFDMKKDRRTGRRISRPIPPEDWKRTDVPHLRIISNDVWEKARARKIQAGQSAPHTQRRYPRLFSGLLKCGHCGGTYTAYTSGKLVCATRREKGKSACENGRTPALAKVEEVVLQGLREELAKPEAVAAYVRAYHRASAERERTALAARAPLERKIAELERGIKRLVDVIERGSTSSTIEARLHELEAEKATASQQLAVFEDAPVVRLHPKAGEVYVGLIDRLRETLNQASAGSTEAQRGVRDAVRGLIDSIVITPRSQARGGPYHIEIRGKLRDFLSHSSEPEGGTGLIKVVAGGGLEPPT
jgi:site-specific DNA recombinase